MDWQSMWMFSLSLAICFHAVGHAAGYLAHRVKDNQLDKLLREIRNVDTRLDSYQMKRVK
jgi:hypothetical protein